MCVCVYLSVSLCVRASLCASVCVFVNASVCVFVRACAFVCVPLLLNASVLCTADVIRQTT